jgi:uncharacterized repeat protein (TIGR02543 family)
MTGYAFTGWNTQADGQGDTINSASQVSITSNIPLFAQWSPLINNITITLEPALGTIQTTSASISNTGQAKTDEQVSIILNLNQDQGVSRILITDFNDLNLILVDVTFDSEGDFDTSGTPINLLSGTIVERDKIYTFIMHTNRIRLTVELTEVTQD